MPRCHLWQAPPRGVRAVRRPHPAGQPGIGPTMSSRGGGAEAQGRLPYNQIFTALSDRFLSHLRDLFICESIGIAQ